MQNNRRKGFLLIFLMVVLAIFSLTFLGNFRVDSFSHTQDKGEQLASNLRMIRQATLMDNVGGENSGNSTADSLDVSTIVPYIDYLGQTYFGVAQNYSSEIIDTTIHVGNFGVSQTTYWGLVENFCINPSFEMESSVNPKVASWAAPLTITASQSVDYPGRFEKLDDIPYYAVGGNQFGKPFQAGTGYCIEITK
ncbi:type II secretion system protein [Candidatus Riflebacteria bacterium]